MFEYSLRLNSKLLELKGMKKMISNIYKIKSGYNNLEEILKESERVSVYNELTKKETLSLRLLCEELYGMLPEILGDFMGEFYIQFEKGLCKVNVLIETEDMDYNKRTQILDVAKNKKNAAGVGFVGKIRSAIEDCFAKDSVSEVYTAPVYGVDAAPVQYFDVSYSECWSLNKYKSSLNENGEYEIWDELEKSVIAATADDVIVGIKGKKAEITIIKRFS